MSNQTNLQIIESYLSVNSEGEIPLKTMLETLQNKIKTNNFNVIEGARIYEIKEKCTVFPVEHSDAKQKTKWEKFAEHKGIKKRKKSRREFCEETQKWEFKFGSKSVQNQKLQSGLIEGEKSVSQLKREKQKRIEKNKKNMIRNKKNANQSPN